MGAFSRNRPFQIEKIKRRHLLPRNCLLLAKAPKPGKFMFLPLSLSHSFFQVSQPTITFKFKLEFAAASESSAEWLFGQFFGHICSSNLRIISLYSFVRCFNFSMFVVLIVLPLIHNLLLQLISIVWREKVI